MKTKTIKLQGKEYAQVKDRIQEFRKENPNGSIITQSDFVGSPSGGTMILKATIVADLSSAHSKTATGQAFGKVDGQKAFEKLETIAVGRALAFLGYASDGEIASSDEMEEFIEFQAEKKLEAMDKLSKCTTVVQLKKVFISLGNLMSDKDIIKTKDEMKLKLNK